MFSIVIPTLQKDNNVLNFLLEELIQCDEVGEIIIIDNSRKGLVIQSEKIRIVTPKENLYVNPAWNLGVSESKYEFVGILNDDIIFPKNIFEQIFKFLKYQSNVGLIGLDSIKKTDRTNFLEYPDECNIEFCNIDVRENCWGSAIFGKKSDFFHIPEEMKVWCGDDYLFYRNIEAGKQNFKIHNAEIKHLHSNTCKLKEFDTIKENDVRLFHNYFPEQRVKLQKKFDLFVSLGAACSCTQVLRSSFLQYYSYPFDWLYGSNFLNRVEILTNGFKNWLEENKLEYIGQRVSPEPCNIYKNKDTEIVFNHDFPIATSLKNSFVDVKTKYDRRINRLLNQIENSKKILFVYMEIPNNRKEVTQKDLIQGYNLLADKFPSADIHLLYLFSTKGVPFKTRHVIYITDKITRISFDYDEYNEEFPYVIRFNLMLELFKYFKITSRHLNFKQVLENFNRSCKRILEFIFSVKNEFCNNSKRKLICILGIKIRIRINKHKL